MSREPVIKRISDATSKTMQLDRGVTTFLIGPEDGARNVDAHINLINIDSGLGPYHYHERAENIYIVLEGIAQAVVDGRRYLLAPDDVAFIPPGVHHGAGSAGYGTVKVLEIYAPAGRDYHIVDDPTDVVEVDRPEIHHLLPREAFE